MTTPGVRLERIGRDLRFGVRSLLRRPAFTAIAVATLALGIGANTAIFTVVNAVLLRPLPFPEPDELVLVTESQPQQGFDQIPLSAEDFRAWRAASRSLESMAGVSPGQFTLTGEGEPERVGGAAVTPGFFDVLDVPAAAGRTLVEGEDGEGTDGVVVLSHGLWERRYGGDPAVVGRTLEVDGRAREVVGVMPPDFRWPSTAELWIPLRFSEAQLQDRNWHFLVTVARLAPDADLEAAEAEMRALAARQSEAFPSSNAGWTAGVAPLHREMVENARTMLLVLLGAVLFVLLIACANVANLLLVRASARERELALRAALGAGRRRLAGQLLTESLLLALVGGAAGVLLALWGVPFLVAASPITVPAGGTAGVDGWVLLFALVASVTTGLVFGIAPALTAWRSDLGDVIKEGGRGSAGGGGSRLRSVLVVAEVALAVVLAAGAGLMIQSVRELQRVDPGFRTQGVLTAQLSLPEAEYATPEEVVAFYGQLLRRVRALPGVRATGLNPWIPPAGGPQFHVRIEGVHTEWTADLPVARTRIVSPGYFEAMAIPLLDGRLLDAEDRPGSPRVAVVDARFAETHWPGERAVGKRLRTLEDEPRQVVGVVGDVKNSGIAGESQPSVYVPYTQTPWNAQGVLIRTTGRDPASVAPQLREIVARLDPDLPLYDVQTLEDRVSSSIAGSRFNMVLLSAFGALALILAAVGIYGVMAFHVAERTREIGLRMALGATSAGVVRMVVRKALLLVGLGIGLGMLAALGLTRLMSGLLYGVQPGDPLTLVAVTAVLALVGVAASLGPGRRASRMDPLDALRWE